MEFSREEERLAREENAKRQRITDGMEFGSLEEHDAAQHVRRAFERIHGLCAIQQEIVDRLQPLFHGDRAISRLYLGIFTITRDFLNDLLPIRGSVLNSTDPLFHQHQRKQMALILLAMGGSLHASAIKYDSMVWPLLRAVVSVQQREPRSALGPARTLLLRRETSGMQEDVREYVEALDQYVRSMES